MEKAQFGMIGLGTMGRNFLLNLAEKGVSCVGFDIDPAKRDLLASEGLGLPVAVSSSVADLASGLKKKRTIMLLVPAGRVVDAVIADLRPHLEKGDLIIDGGNSHFADTERREAELSAWGLGFLGVGVSGGEEGARHGACIMAGGRPELYERVRPMFESVSAKVKHEPCAAQVGRGAAGHFAKMVHNGIEYALMQLIAETYDYLHRVLAMDTNAIADVFEEWNSGELRSFLIEITATVLRKTDPETGGPLVDVIVDAAGQKGTGRWASQAAMEFGIPVPTIDAAVTMRQISSLLETRRVIGNALGTPPYVQGVTAKASRVVAVDMNLIGVAQIRDALLCGFVIAYSQGLSLLQAASVEKSYELNIAELARIWRGGCIIRSALLDQIRSAYTKDPALPSLFLDKRVRETLTQTAEPLRKLVSAFVGSGLPGMAFSSTLGYFDALRSERLPANLIQAQRDLFGAHAYRRIDKEGTFHTPDWEK